MMGDGEMAREDIYICSVLVGSRYMASGNCVCRWGCPPETM
jgi:hypothetical protein